MIVAVAAWRGCIRSGRATGHYPDTGRPFLVTHHGRAPVTERYARGIHLRRPGRRPTPPALKAGELLLGLMIPVIRSAGSACASPPRASARSQYPRAAHELPHRYRYFWHSQSRGLTPSSLPGTPKPATGSAKLTGTASSSPAWTTSSAQHRPDGRPCPPGPGRKGVL
jgi:hypothetical protein